MEVPNAEGKLLSSLLQDLVGEGTEGKMSLKKRIIQQGSQGRSDGMRLWLELQLLSQRECTSHCVAS